MKKIALSILAASGLLLTACATTVKPTYVSPTQYQSLNCQQLQAEYDRIQQYLDQGVSVPKSTGMGVDVGLGGGWSRGKYQKDRDFPFDGPARCYCTSCSV